MLRIGVMGAGAVGSLIGGLLSRAGFEIVLVGRRAHVAAIAQKGLTIKGVETPLVVHPAATTDVSALAEVSVVLLTVKSQDTAPASREIAPYLPADAVVVSLQNGVRNPEIINGILGEGRVIAGVVLLGAEYLSPGEVSLSMAGYLVIGEGDGTLTPRVEEVSRILGAAVETKITTNISGAMWAKLVINLDLPIYSLTGLEYPQGLLEPAIHNISLKAMEEGMDVLGEAKIELGRNPVEGAMLGKIELLRLPHNELVGKLATRQGGGFKPSALQSVLRGSSSEIDFINGDVVRLSEAVGVRAPINQALLRMAAETSSGGRPRFLTPEELERYIERAVSHG